MISDSFVVFPFVSIHAPTKGATVSGIIITCTLKCFNPRSHEGSDNITQYIIISIPSFNPRSHEGSDAGAQKRRSTSATFQSTLPRRERHTITLRTDTHTRFQSTLPRRERRFSRCFSSFTPRFQSTLPRRERRFRLGLCKRFCIGFNPRSHEGSDFKIPNGDPAVVPVSIHAPTKGATEARQRLRVTHGSFNPRSHEGSDLPGLDF